MRLVTSSIALIFVMLAARAGSGDPAPTVLADCKTAVTPAGGGGLGIRVVEGGFTPGMQAYIHELPATNAKTRDPGFVGALNVKYGIKPMNNTVQMVVIAANTGATFQLEIKKAKTTGGENTAALIKGEVNGKKLDAQDMVCTLPAVAAPPPPACDDAKKPAACPGGGVAMCRDGQWACPPLPKPVQR